MAGQLRLGDAAEVEQVARVDHGSDLLVGDDALHHRVLVGAVDVGDQEEPGGRRPGDVLGDELLLQRLRECQQVLHVGRDLGRACLHVGQQPGVAPDRAEQPGRPEARELVRLVGPPHPRPCAADRQQTRDAAGHELPKGRATPAGVGDQGDRAKPDQQDPTGELQPQLGEPRAEGVADLLA